MIMRNILIVTLILTLNSCNNSSEEKPTLKPKNSKTETTNKQFPKLDSARYNVGFLIMDGTFNTELTAPYDIFQHTIFRKNIKAMNVFTIADTDKPITTFEG